MVQSSKSKALWVRHEKVPSPWASRGGLAVLIFGALVAIGVLVLAPLTIAPQIDTQVRVRLAGMGVEPTHTRVVGQQVQVQARVPAHWGKHRREQAHAVVATTKCPTWAGNFRCPDQVELILHETKAEPSQAPDLVQAATPAVNEVEKAAPSARVEQEVSAKEDTQPSAASQAAQRCDAALAQSLAESSIRFRSASSRILPESNALLDRLAEQVKSCPGQIQIEGHSDNVGKESSNQWLSRARAHAVRRALTHRGVQEQRLVAVGKGSVEPIADNGTAKGRAKNRRIEMRVQTTPAR